MLRKEHMIGVSHISRVNVSWSALMARIRPWPVLSMEYHKDLFWVLFSLSYLLMICHFILQPM